MTIVFTLIFLFFQINRITIVVQWEKKLTNQPTAVFKSTSDLVYVIEQSRNSLEIFHSNNHVIRSVGGHGVGNYEFDAPTDVSSSFLLDVYVTDFNNRRIQRFDKNLNYIQTYDEATLSGEIGRFQPRACALSSQGDLFVIETDGNRILKLDTRGRFVREFGTYKDGAGMVTEPKDIAVSAGDEIFVLDNSKIIAYDRFGNYLRTISLPAAEWKNIQVSDQTLLATASDQLFLRSLVDEEQTTLPRSSIAGISSNEQFVDAVFMKDKLILLTTTTLYYCSFSR